jgi:hypothetical protein
MANVAFRWFRFFIWTGIILNMGFWIPAFVAPRWFLSQFGMPLYNFEGVQNAAMLLVSLSFFYILAAYDPLRNKALAWLAVLSRLIAVIFWLWLFQCSPHADALRPALYLDLIMFLVLAVTLQRGLPAGEKLTFGGILAALKALNPLPWLRGRFAARKVRIIGLAVSVVVAALGFVTWDNLIRARPVPVFVSDEEHYKYGVIGLGMTARVPFYVFEVLPEVFPEKFPRTGTYADYGLIQEVGQDVPIGFAKRQVGFVSVEPNCALCHTGAYRKSAGDKLVPILGAPAHMLDLQGFQWMLYDCAADERFTADTLMKAIEKRHELSATERLTYQTVIIPMAKEALMTQGRAYAWQKSRPHQGKGRTDTFNPTKFNVMDFPWDKTIGTVDLPQVWNQKPRESLHLHWDGNNNDLTERNYAAAMAVGATPESVLPKNFKRVTDYLLTLPPPKYPFDVDAAKAARGQGHYDRNCASCHQFGQPKTGQVTPLEEIGTDAHRLFSFTEQLVEEFHTYDTAPFVFKSYVKTYGYANTPLDGIWARGPYLHNGSIPSLWDLLQAPGQRPKKFYAGYEVYDEVNVGFVSSGPEAEKAGSLLDTTRQGNGNQGHLYGSALTEVEKRELVEFLKTL